MNINRSPRLVRAAVTMPTLKVRFDGGEGLLAGMLDACYGPTPAEVLVSADAWASSRERKDGAK